jgi:hypothetical protein
MGAQREGETMNLVQHGESMSRSNRTLVPVTRWESVQFSPDVSRKRVETIIIHSRSHI